MNIRRAVSAAALALTLTGSPFIPATAAGPARPTRADWRAIAELVDAWRAWITAVTVTPYTGPECPGRWAVPTSVVWRESRCLFDVRNPLPGSTAGGAYQLVARSRDWALTAAGLPEWVGTLAEHLPPWVQHRAAAALWADSPCHWAPNPWCR